MSLTHSPKIITDGLVMYYDMPNGKSFVGAPVTNTLDNPSINGYPTYGNGWGTYNTNQYNNNTYFSIGTIASISSNIVTTTTAHPLFSYSVVTPQSSGGGLTAGTNYLIKKLSSTTFTIHAYNGSQDGSQGYINPTTGTHKVFDDFANDVKVAVSASGFPTMWWGPPHLPNSCLVKEIIPAGFTGIPGRAATDCIRLHYIQPDGIADGMAYGPNGAVVAGQPYTMSFWTRSVTPNAVGSGGYYQIYNHGVVGPTTYGLGFTLGALGVWTKQVLNFTPINPYCISYWFPNQGNMKYDIADIQFEVGSIANNFVAGTRSTTEVIKDLTGNTTLTANSLTYASDGTFSFNGSSDYITAPSTGLAVTSWTQPWTLGVWMYVPASATWSNGTNQSHFVSKGNTSGSWGLIRGSNNNTIHAAIRTDAAVYQTGGSITRDAWYNVVGTWDGISSVKTYINGVLADSATAVTLSGVPDTQDLIIGQGSIFTGSAGIYYTGKLPSVVGYNRALSAAEVKQNFTALRGRYGI